MESNNCDGAASSAAVTRAENRENALTVKQAMRLYKKAIFFSVIFSSTIIIESYGLALISTYYAYDPFTNQFADVQVGDGQLGAPLSGNDTHSVVEGLPHSSQPREIAAHWQTGIIASALVSAVIGTTISGWFTDRWGYRKTMCAALVFLTATTTIIYEAKNLSMILVGIALVGIPYGMFQTVAISYASDISPKCLRAYFTTYTNLCWVMGQLLASGVTRAFLSMTDDRGWRTPVALEWIVPPLVILGLVFAPESPKWLVGKGKEDEAKKAMSSLTQSNSGIDFDISDHIAMLQDTDLKEKEISVGYAYTDCFKGTNLRRTEISSVVWLAQAYCGATLFSYAVQLFRHTKLNPDQSFSLNIGISALSFICTLGSWPLMAHFGRRTIFLYSLAIHFIILTGLGITGCLKSETAGWIGAALLVLMAGVYNNTLGPVCYSIVPEIPSQRLKIKTLAIARNTYNTGQIINAVLMPRFILNSEWDLGALVGFYWAFWCAILWIYAYYRLPEIKDKQVAQLDELFEAKVPARNFVSRSVPDVEVELITSRSKSSVSTTGSSKVMTCHVETS